MRTRIQASCSMPRKLLSLYSQRVTKRRKLCSPAKNRSTFQRRQKRRKARRSCVGGLRRLLFVRSNQIDTLFLFEFFIERIALISQVAAQFLGNWGAKWLSSVASSSRVSCGEGLATCTTTGTPWPSVTAMILVPLPRFVLPTAEPPFSLPRRRHRWLLRSGRAFPAALDPRPAPVKSLRNDRP